MNGMWTCGVGLTVVLMGCGLSTWHELVEFIGFGFGFLSEKPNLAWLTEKRNTQNLKILPFKIYKILNFSFFFFSNDFA